MFTYWDHNDIGHEDEDDEQAARLWISARRMVHCGWQLLVTICCNLKLHEAYPLYIRRESRDGDNG
jgi:hypothetical protein